MGSGSKTDRFRAVFEPEAIFDRFVKNANASVEVATPDEDAITGCMSREEVQARTRRGGPPAWDHQVTVVAPDAEPPPLALRDDEPPVPDHEGTKPDAPMPLAMQRAFASSEQPAIDDDVDSVEDEWMTVPRAAALTTDSGQRILLLTKVKPSLEPATPPTDTSPISEDTITGPAPAMERPPESGELPLEDRASPSWQSVVAPRGRHTQQLEARRLVPDVESVHQKQDGPPSGETGEDGQIPTRELDHLLSDMAVLLRYGHAGQVRDRLDALRRAYPEDLLLLRRIAELYLEHGVRDAALDALFALARGLFERRNVEGMRQALEQILVLDASNARARRLLGLLEARADGTDA
ncbi:MAG: hypothetical protein KF729_29705 [Sandaracinaceae bacterium]|nr:hypothetical protein [Sandaracinaceae bacterium]